MAGTLVADILQDGSANSGNTTDMIKGSARAWVNFTQGGTHAIINSYNVSSITDAGTGHSHINFIYNMPDADYVVSLSGDHRPGVSYGFEGFVIPVSANMVAVWSVSAGSVFDNPYMHVVIHR